MALDRAFGTVFARQSADIMDQHPQCTVYNLYRAIHRVD